MKMVYGITVFIAWTLLQAGTSEEEVMYCANFGTSGGGDGRHHDISGGVVMPDNRTIRCMEGDRYCFALWYDDPTNSSNRIFIKQGCWIGDCQTMACESTSAPKNNSKFCCCSGRRCNENVTDVYIQKTTDLPITPGASAAGILFPVPLQDPTYRQRTIIISLVSVCAVALVIVILYFLYRMYLLTHRRSLDSLTLIEAPPPSGFQIEDLKLCHSVSRGRYAEVWRGLLNDQEVAVKIYGPHHRQYYLAERNTYMLPLMDHENLLRFYGADERLSQEGHLQYLIVLSYVPLGSLSGYLKNNTLDWPALCKMCLSVARGLSHLHTDIMKGDKFKPVVAHRDFNSRNVLVRDDLECIVADLGFCVPTMGSKLIKNGHKENAEQTSLTDVGTPRYMAPELLDGAVNLRDCEASLKQIDIYALGLVIWEIAKRCTDLYQGAPVPEYMLPYQSEAGTHPSFEDMQLLVSRQKVRPKFPEVWKDSNQAVRALKETIEDCWDQDAEARLTVLCVEERVSEMIMLWAQDSKNRGKSLLGVTPTINATMNLTQFAYIEKSSEVDHSVNQLDSYMVNLTENALSPSLSPTTETSSASVLGHSEPPSHPLSHLQSSQDYSQSGGSTTESILPLTPSDTDPPPKANNVMLAKSNLVLQPHQGRNPTVARNTHKCSDEELNVSGNTLLGPSSKAPPQVAPPSSSQFADNPFDSVGDELETSLVQNDALSHHRNPPIPYVQNPTHLEGPVARPKVANVPGNGVPYSKLTNGESRSFREKLGKLIKPKELGLKLSHLGIFGAKSGGNRQDGRWPGEEGDHGHTTGGWHPPDYEEIPNETSPLNPSHPNLTPRQVEVCLQNGRPCVRPSNLVLQELPAMRSMVNGVPPHNGLRYSENRLGMAEVGVAHLHAQVSRGRQCRPCVVLPSQSRSTSDLTPPGNVGTSRWQETRLTEQWERGQRRPSSLSLQGHNCGHSLPGLPTASVSAMRPRPASRKSDNHQSCDSDKSRQLLPVESESSQKIKRRVKTPVMANKNRLSLYDDRLMCQGSLEEGSGPSPDLQPLKKSCLSLYQMQALNHADYV